MNVFNWKFRICTGLVLTISILSLSVNLSRHNAGLHWSLYAIAVTRIGDITALVIIQLCLSSDDDHGSIMRVISAGVPDMGSCGIDIYIWLWAVVHDG